MALGKHQLGRTEAPGVGEAQRRHHGKWEGFPFICQRRKSFVIILIKQRFEQDAK